MVTERTDGPRPVARTVRLDPTIDDQVTAFARSLDVEPSRQRLISFLIARGLEAVREGRKDAGARMTA